MRLPVGGECSGIAPLTKWKRRDREEHERDAPAAVHREVAVAQRAPRLATRIDERVGLAAGDARVLRRTGADLAPDRLVVERLDELALLLLLRVFRFARVERRRLRQRHGARRQTKCGNRGPRRRVNVTPMSVDPLVFVLRLVARPDLVLPLLAVAVELGVVGRLVGLAW
jgi:hypothetical protein